MNQMGETTEKIIEGGWVCHHQGWGLVGRITSIGTKRGCGVRRGGGGNGVHFKQYKGRQGEIWMLEYWNFYS